MAPFKQNVGPPLIITTKYLYYKLYIIIEYLSTIYNTYISMVFKMYHYYKINFHDFLFNILYKVCLLFFLVLPYFLYKKIYDYEK